MQKERKMGIGVYNKDYDVHKYKLMLLILRKEIYFDQKRRTEEKAPKYYKTKT